MIFRKALILSTNNWKVMVKALICQVLILALLTALCFTIFGELVDDIINVFTAGEWDEFLSATVTSIGEATFNGSAFVDGLKACLEKTQNAIESFPNIWNKVEISYVLTLVIVIVYRMLIAFSDVAVGFQLNEFMTSNTVRPFTWYLVKKFGESCKFIFFQMLVTLPLDAILLAGSIMLALVFVLTIKWWIIIPVLLIVLALYAVRLTYLAFWLPSLVSDEVNVRQSLVKGLSAIPYRFGKTFIKTFAVVLMMATLTVVSVTFIHNNILKIVVSTVPNLMLFFFLKCINLMEYFEATHRPYFYKHIDVEGTESYNRKQKHRKVAEQK